MLSGDGYERLIYEPDERPTEPMALPSGAAADTFAEGGGYLPSLAATTAAGLAGGMLRTQRPWPDGGADCAVARSSRIRRSTR